MCLDSRVTTVVPHTFKVWFKQRTRWGLGGLQALAKYRKMFFSKGMFGMFVLPFVSFSIIMSIVTFLFSSFLLLKFILTGFLSAGTSLAVNTTILSSQDINFYPSAIIFYFIVLFILSIWYYWYVLKTLKYDKKLTPKKFFTIVFYLLIYLTIYPIVWFASIYRYWKKDFSW